MNAAAASSPVDEPPDKRIDSTLKLMPWDVRAALARGLVTRARPASDEVSLSPSFIITAGEVDDMVVRACSAVDAVTDEVLRDRVWADTA